MINIDNVKKNRARSLKWYYEHKAKRKKYIEKNKEEIQKYKKQYCKNNSKILVKKSETWLLNKLVTEPNYIKIKSKKEKEKYNNDFNIKENRQVSSLKWIHSQDPIKMKEKNHIKYIKRGGYKYFKNKRKNDIEYHLIHDLRTLLNRVFILYSTTGKIMSSKKYGIDYEAIIKKLIDTLPADFQDNPSKYHKDHIIACVNFDWNNPETPSKCFCAENMQWLTKEENLKKGSKPYENNNR
jgi:hypothetical protein